MASEAKSVLINEEPSADDLAQMEVEDYSKDIESNYKAEDSVNVYLREISKIPLLTAVEEKQCGEDLKNVKNLNIVKRIKGRPCFVLNLSMIFVSLVDSNNRDFIINTLIDYYKTEKKEVNKKLIDTLNRYQVLCKKLGRTPTLDDLTIEFKFSEQNPYLESFNSIDSLSDEELLNEINVFLKYCMAYEKMVNSNLRFVVNMSKSYANKFQLPILDLISEGNIGLMKAVDKYDVDKGFKFSTYASWWIKQSVSRYSYANMTSFNVPEYMAKDAKKIIKEVAELEAKEGRKFEISELAEMYGMQESTMLACLTTATNEMLSFSQPVGDENDSTLEDFIADDSNGLESTVFQNSLSEDIKFLFDGLTPREIGIIKLRFGIGTVNGYAYTLEEVGKKYKVTRERIRQIEAKVLYKMRKKANYTKQGKALKSYLD